MAVTVKVNTPGLDSFEKAVEKVNILQLLFKTGELTKAKILRNWNNSQGADGTPLKPLSNEYKELKSGDGILVDGAYRRGQPKPDFLLSGKLQRALFTSPSGPAEVEISVRGEERHKALSNQTLRPNMFNINEKTEKEIINRFRRLLTKEIKNLKG